MNEAWTTERVREMFLDDGGQAEYYDPINGAREQRRIAGDIFDRWLNEHDRQVAERAWDEGYNAGHYVETEKHECDCPRANPYRKDQENTNA